MKFGLTFLLKSPLRDRDSCMHVAQRAEALGFSYLSLSDRLVTPVQVNSHYPYTDDGKVGSHWLSNEGQVMVETLEIMTTIGFLAGCTEQIKLVTNTLIIPYRPVLLAAKMLVSADILSKGRMVAGVAAGWMKEEFDLLQNDSFHHRGKLLDEQLEAFDILCHSDAPAYEGKYVKFRDLVFAPKPYNGHIPIWIGGESPAALKRVALHANGWAPMSNNKSLPLDSPEGFTIGLNELRRACDTAKRDFSKIDIALWPAAFKRNQSDSKNPFYGPPDKVLEDIDTYTKLGMTHLTMQLQHGFDRTYNVSEYLDNMQRFAEEVMPHVHERIPALA